MRRCIGLLGFLGVLVMGCGFGRGQGEVPTAVSAAIFPTDECGDAKSCVSTPPPSEPVVAPTAQPTAVPLPSPTFSPDLADWTVLVYMAADNSLAPAGLRDLNEMETAVLSSKVNVLVQIDRAAGTDDDWHDARRYRVQPDEDTTIINSPLLAELGEVNMGAAQTLADFVQWGIASYPANRYALIVWDHGAGWNGIAFDNDNGVDNGGDHLSLGELAEGLSVGLQAAGVDKLDVVAFDACLMGQLDVFAAVQPLADFAVGSEELTPGQGWDYGAVLGHLAANVGQNGRSFAQQLVGDFIAAYPQEPFVTMSAVDLAQLPTVSHAVEQLAAQLAADSRFAASAVADARSGAETYARVYAEEVERYGAVDLHHFAAILTQRNADDAVTAAASGVMTAVEQAVVASGRGNGLPYGRGVAVYFPRNGRFYRDSYAQTTHLPTWNQFLQQYYDATGVETAVPSVEIVNVASDTAGLQQPLYLDWQIVGREIENGVLLGGLYQDDGRRRLLEYDNLIPKPTLLPDGSQLWAWRDGLHEDFFVWDTQVTYLYDSSGAGGFVVMWPSAQPTTDPTTRELLFSVPGQYWQAGAASGVEASLLFDHRRRELVRVWEGGAAAAEIVPLPGDSFQVYDYYLADDEAIERELGGRLTFDAAGRLYFDWRPLPNGRYFLGFRAENVAGQSATALTDVVVINDGNLPGLRTYLDPYLGFRFNYPDSWYEPRYDGTLLYTASISPTTTMQVVIYPDLLPSTDAARLQAQTLQAFGEVALLYEDEVVVNGRSARRVAYGYDDGTIAHTGVFLAFVQDGTGFVVDVDGLAAAEEATLTAVADIAASWQTIAVGSGLQPGRWATVDLERFSVVKRADFVNSRQGEWEKFAADSQTFVALRTAAAQFSEVAVLSSLVQAAGSEVSDFAAERPFRTLLGGAVWQRVDFSYVNGDSEEIWGFVMVRVADGQEISAWAEAPRAVYNELESEVFLLMIADLTLR